MSIGAGCGGAGENEGRRGGFDTLLWGWRRIERKSAWRDDPERRCVEGDHAPLSLLSPFFSFFSLVSEARGGREAGGRVSKGSNMPKAYREKEYNRHTRIAAKQVNRAQLGCAQEVQVLLTCMKKHGYDALSSQCMKDARRLTQCVASLGNEKKQKDTLNYHLQRLSKIMKKKR